MCWQICIMHVTFVFVIKKVKQSRYTPWRRLGGERYSSYSFTTSALDGGEWSASRPGRAFTPGERTPGTHCTGGWVGPRAGLDTQDRGRSFVYGTKYFGMLYRNSSPWWWRQQAPLKVGTFKPDYPAQHPKGEHTCIFLCYLYTFRYLLYFILRYFFLSVHRFFRPKFCRPRRRPSD